VPRDDFEAKKKKKLEQEKKETGEEVDLVDLSDLSDLSDDDGEGGGDESAPKVEALAARGGGSEVGEDALNAAGTPPPAAHSGDVECIDLE